MEDIIKIASYVRSRYEKEYGERIDEIKLHRLLYLIQRESIIQTNEPMFKEKFQAQKYGPVSVEIRQAYMKERLNDLPDTAVIDKHKDVFDKVFETYSGKDYWSLSCLVCCEYSYKKARGEKLKKYDDCSEYIDVNDIYKDAYRIKFRRKMCTA